MVPILMIPVQKEPETTVGVLVIKFYMIRFTPTVENINDATKYEYYGGKMIKETQYGLSTFQKIQFLN